MAGLLTAEENDMSIRIITPAPAIAPISTLICDAAPEVMCIQLAGPNIINATPREAPVLTPKMEGPANGLLNVV